MIQPRGVVYLVGAGPGDPGLITVRGLQLLRDADVVIHDRLIPHELLAEARHDAVVIDAGKAPGAHKQTQDQTNALIVEHALAGRNVVRLKGGDPFVFGRGYEEWTACGRAGIHCEVIPGVTSAVAGPAAAGIPVTHRGIARNFAVVTARTGETDDASDLDYAALVKLDTLVVLMGRAGLRDVAANLILAGRSTTTPVACVQEATTSAQRVVVADLASIAAHADEARLAAPMVMVVGEVARFASEGLGVERLIDAIDPALIKPPNDLRIVLTGSPDLNRKLVHLLVNAGASVIDCRLVSIRYEGDKVSRDEFARCIFNLNWLVFASGHGVGGLVRALRDAGIDLRTLAGVKIAAVGCGTAKKLRQHGLHADVVPKAQTAAGLIAELGGAVKGGRILLPCGDLSRNELADGLTELGASVEKLIVYRNVPASLTKEVAAELRHGFDAIVFASPSAVERFAQTGIDLRDAIVACIGPTTASAARSAGLAPQVVATQHSAEGLVNALLHHLSVTRVPS